MVPIAINYRALINNKIFCINYKFKHFCSGSCKFSNQPFENLISQPYIDVHYIFYTDENICKNANDLFKNYIYINIKYKYIIIRIFEKEIKLYNQIYKLIDFVTQANSDHYVAYFQNHNDLYSKNKMDWLIFDGLIGSYNILNNTEFSLDNIRSSEPTALLIYLRQ